MDNNYNGISCFWQDVGIGMEQSGEEGNTVFFL